MPNFAHKNRVEIYNQYEVSYTEAENLSAALNYAEHNPQVFDYRCPEFELRKLNDATQWRVLPPAKEQEATCLECGNELTLVRPGKHQCDHCEHQAARRSERFHSSDLVDPDEVGSSEYRAIYDVLDEVEGITVAEVLAICQEFQSHADAIIQRLTRES